MKIKTRLFVSTLAFLFAVGILGVSLATAPQAISTSGSYGSNKKLYLGTILPDHVLYPVQMAVDRIELETSPQSERVFMEVAYAHRRLGYTEELLKQKKESLAVSTLAKAEAYLYDATHDALNIQAPASVKDRVAKAIEYHMKQMRVLSPEFTDTDRVAIDKFVEQDTLLVQSLK